MTRKDYVKIAAALRPYLPDPDPDATRQNCPARRVPRWYYEDIVKELANVMKADNPRFDDTRFYWACGLED